MELDCLLKYVNYTDLICCEVLGWGISGDVLAVCVSRTRFTFTELKKVPWKPSIISRQECQSLTHSVTASAQSGHKKISCDFGTLSFHILHLIIHIPVYHLHHYLSPP